MTVSNDINSHVQLIVPESYLFGGEVEDVDFANAFDGDVDSSVVCLAINEIQWTYPSALSIPTFTLLYRHYGNTGNYKITHGGGDVTITDYAQEWRGQSDDDWDFALPATNFTRNGASENFSNLLLEHTGVTTAADADRFYINTGDAGSNFREVMFSRDYRLPMFSRTWSGDYSFRSDTESNYVGVSSPRFDLRTSYAMNARHQFQWRGLTATEKFIAELFIRAFGGNMMRPFAMCIIHGYQPSGLDQKVMTTRMLIIDDQSVQWSHDDLTDTYGFAFNATELIPL